MKSLSATRDTTNQTPLKGDGNSPWRRLFTLLRQDRPRMLAGALAALLSTAAGIALLAVSGHFITRMALAGIGGLTINYYTPAALIRLFAILRTGGRYVERLVTHDATLSILARLRCWLFARLVPLAPAALGTLGSAELYSRIRADIDTLEHAYLSVLTPVVVALLTSLGVLAVTACFAPWLALALTVLYVTAGVLLPWWTLHRGNRPSRVADELAESMRWQMADGLRGRAELALFGAEAAHAERLDTTLARRQQALRQVQKLQAVADAGITLLVQLACAAALGLGIWALRHAALGGAELTMLVLLAMAGFDAIAPLPSAWARLGAVRAAAVRVFELADREPAVAEPSATASAARPSGAGETKQDLRWTNVWLRYGDPPHWALKGVDLMIPQGRHVAIIGPSGAGKSSLIAALCRFQPYRGRITLGGISLDSMPGDDVRACFAVVEQKPYLFDGSLRDNLQIACPTATDEQLIEALDQAQLSACLQQLPRGLDSWVGENGTGLSGGEARRIAVARALLSPAPILVLDEPTEGLDATTANALYASLAEQTKGRTVILITHKLGALAQLVDEVIAMADGTLGEHVDVAAYLLGQTQAHAARLPATQTDVQAHAADIERMASPPRN
jgi:ATP-binding cassette subfamily C protein CydC